MCPIRTFTAWPRVFFSKAAAHAELGVTMRTAVNLGVGLAAFGGNADPWLDLLDFGNWPAPNIRVVGRPDRLAGQRQVDGIPEPGDAYRADESSDFHPIGVALDQDLGHRSRSTEKLTPPRDGEVGAAAEPGIGVLAQARTSARRSAAGMPVRSVSSRIGEASRCMASNSFRPGQVRRLETTMTF